MRIVLFVVFSLLLLLGFGLIWTRSWPSRQEDTFQFAKEQQRIDEFNKQHNFFAEDVPVDLARRYLKLLLKRFPAESAEVQEDVHAAAEALLPSFLQAIADFKAGMIESKGLATFKRTYLQQVSAQKSDMAFVSVYGLIGLELLEKLGTDAQGVGDEELAHILDLAFTQLNNALLMS